MTVYMVRNNETGLYYRKGSLGTRGWCKQSQASIWTTLNGPSQVKSRYIRHNKTPAEIIKFELREIK
jgi:hypothetical protein